CCCLIRSSNERGAAVWENSPQRSTGVTLSLWLRELILTFSLSPRLTGTLNGSCNNRGSTFVTTNGSTTVWSMVMRMVYGFTSQPTSPTRRNSFGSSRTTTNPELLWLYLPQRNGP